MGNQRFIFGKEETRNSLKVFGWTMASALIVLALDFVGALEVPTEYAFVVPVVNTVLYSLKEWIADNR